MQNLRQKVYSTLRKSESFFKTDMVYLAKGGSWTTAGSIVISFLSFLLAISFAHFVSKEAYGQYKFVLAMAGILGTLTLTGLGSAVMRSVSRGFEGTLHYAFWTNIRWSILGFLGALGMSIYYFAHGNSSLGLAMLIAGSFSPFLSSTNLYSSYLTAKKDFRRHAIYFDIIGNLFPYTALFVTMLLTESPLWLVFIYFSSNTLIGIILYKRIVKIYRPGPEVDTESLGYSKHLSLMNILNGLANNIDQVLVFHYIGAAQLAIYNFAIAIPDQIKGPLKGLNKMIFPKFVERDHKEIHSGMGRKFMILFIGSVVITLIYILVAPYIFQIFFPKYMASVFYSQIFALSLLSITFNPASVYLAAKKKIKEQYISYTFISILQIVVVSVSIIYWGLLGLIIARVVMRLANSITNAALYYYSINRELA